MVKNLHANAGDACLVPGLGRSPEKEMATHSSIPAWKIPFTEEPGVGYYPWGHKESDTILATDQQYSSLQKSIFIYLFIYMYFNLTFKSQ